MRKSRKNYNLIVGGVLTAVILAMILAGLFFPAVRSGGDGYQSEVCGNLTGPSVRMR